MVKRSDESLLEQPTKDVKPEATIPYYVDSFRREVDINVLSGQPLSILCIRRTYIMRYTKLT